MRVARVVNNERSSETIAILGRQVGVVPESTYAPAIVRIRLPLMNILCKLTSLICRVEVVQEGVSSCDWALVDHGRAIGPVGSLLEETVPVLKIPMRNDSYIDQARSLQ